jgi:metal-dependent hydrolase (beta-lactamase superfamily II)
MEYASKGVAGAGLGLGIAGTALGLLNGGGGLLNAMAPNQMACSESQFVNRYELSMQNAYEKELSAKNTEISALQADVKLRDANIYTDAKMLEMYKYFDGEIKRVDGVLANQAVINAQQTGIIGCMQGQIAQLYNLTKLVIPNTSVCPGWGNVTVAPATTTTG